MRCAHCGLEKKIAGKGYCSACFSRLRRTGSLARTNVQRFGHCLADGCSKPIMAKGLCSLHYSRQQHPLLQTWKNLRSRYGSEVCKRWHKGFEKFLEDVGERPSPQHQLRRKDNRLEFGPNNVKWLPPVTNEKIDYYSPDQRSAYSRNWMLKARYGLSLERHAEMLKEQGFVCAICKTEEEFLNSRTGRKQELSVDHCHETDRVRGLLCVGCNRGLGYFKDSKEALRAAITYLEKHELVSA